MKTKFFASLLWMAFAFLPFSGHASNGSHDDINVVITPQRILFLTDETPVASIAVQVKDKNGKVVLEKNFSSKTVNWTLDVEQLPAGSYKLMIDNQLYKNFTL